MSTDSKKPESIDSPTGGNDVSRREFIDRAAALGVSTAVLASMIAAGTLPREAEAATPKRGGHLRVGTADGNTSDNLDPHLKNSGITHVALQAMRNTMGEVDHTGKLVPELAESWEPGDSADTWIFNLRKDVTFHDGKILDQDDVIKTINYHRRKGSKSAMRAFAATIKDLNKDGTHRVVFQLHGKNASFPFIGGLFEINAFKNDGSTEPYDLANGTGSYILKEFKPGQRITLERNPNHFRDSVGWFDSARLTPMLDVAARQNALVTGEVDVINRPSPKTFPLLKRTKGIKVKAITGKLHRTWPMDARVAPFDNEDVRKALRFSVDREEIVKKVLNGGGSLGNDHPIARADPMYNPNLKQRVYDPDQAKFHLKKAGMENLTVKLSSSEAIWAGAIDAAQLYSESAKKAGIDLVVNKVPNDGYWSNVWLKHSWSTSYWNAGPTADHILTRAYGAEAAWNETMWKHPRFNMLLNEARGELDFNKAREMYWEMQEILHEEGSTVIPVFADELYAHSDKLAHGQLASNWEMDGFHLVERWWFA
jgi:peptide/nickel transport system substrate-binding protein